VPYVINPGDEPLAATTTAYQGEGVTISQVPGARPFAFTSDTIACAASPGAAANLLTQRGPMGPVVLQTGACPATSVANVRIRERQPERIAISVEATLPTVVVVLQSYTRDWSATVDGQPAPILKANLYFQAVAVPAGAHELSFTYAPSAVGVGEILSVAALAILFALCLVAIGQTAVPKAAAVP
jgi:Bacterial membrane protein YfhO